MFLREDNIAQGAIKINLLVDKLLGNYNVSISDVPQALTVLCHFPFTYSFSEDLMISQVDQGGNYLAVTPPRLQHTPFYFLRLFVHDKTITEYSYDE